jgi:hypothetical protein
LGRFLNGTLLITLAGKQGDQICVVFFVVGSFFKLPEFFGYFLHGLCCTYLIWAIFFSQTHPVALLRTG